MGIPSESNHRVALAAIRRLYAASEHFPLVVRAALAQVLGARRVTGFVKQREALVRYGDLEIELEPELLEGSTRLVCGGAYAYLCVDHGDRGRSVWVLEQPDEGAMRIFGKSLATNLAQAGRLNLPAPEVSSRPVSARGEALFDVDVTPLPAGDLLAGLTPEANEAVRLAARGYTNVRIAEHMGLSVASVARRLAVAYTHLGIKGRREIPVKALLALPKPSRRAH